MSGNGFDDLSPSLSARFGRKWELAELGASAEVDIEGNWSAGLNFTRNWG